MELYLRFASYDEDFSASSICIVLKTASNAWKSTSMNMRVC